MTLQAVRLSTCCRSADRSADQVQLLLLRLLRLLLLVLLLRLLLLLSVLVEDEEERSQRTACDWLHPARGADAAAAAANGGEPQQVWVC